MKPTFTELASELANKIQVGKAGAFHAVPGHLSSSQFILIPSGAVIWCRTLSDTTVRCGTSLREAFSAAELQRWAFGPSAEALGLRGSQPTPLVPLLRLREPTKFVPKSACRRAYRRCSSSQIDTGPLSRILHSGPGCGAKMDYRTGSATPYADRCTYTKHS